MELIHICANATCPINQQCSSLEHGRQIKKTFQIVKEQTRRQDARKIELQVVRDSKLVEPIGIEPMTSCLQSRRSPN